MSTDLEYREMCDAAADAIESFMVGHGEGVVDHEIYAVMGRLSRDAGRPVAAADLAREYDCTLALASRAVVVYCRLTASLVGGPHVVEMPGGEVVLVVGDLVAETIVQGDSDHLPGTIARRDDLDRGVYWNGSFERLAIALRRIRVHLVETRGKLIRLECAARGALDRSGMADLSRVLHDDLS